jgi:hypothetical protein
MFLDRLLLFFCSEKLFGHLCIDRLRYFHLASHSPTVNTKARPNNLEVVLLDPPGRLFFWIYVTVQLCFDDHEHAFSI